MSSKNLFSIGLITLGSIILKKLKIDEVVRILIGNGKITFNSKSLIYK